MIYIKALDNAKVKLAYVNLLRIGKCIKKIGIAGKLSRASSMIRDCININSRGELT